jgi:bifunctional non-homologous end joining protein LigD
MTKTSSTLYYREGSSDKVYQAAIEETTGGFVVNFAYGRRGSTLNTGTKTQSPVPFDQAQQIFEALIKSKLAKGYTPGEEGTPYQHTDKEERSTGILPQLCNPIDSAEVKELIADNHYYLQEKFDGRRILLQKNPQGVVGINRKGLIVGLPKPVEKAALLYVANFLLDGECIGDVFHAFDILSLGEDNLRTRPCRERLRILQETLRLCLPHLQLVETVISTAGKTERFLNLRLAHKEGVVFKRADAPYTVGRPASGGSWLKHKFTTTGSFIVSAVNSQRSVGLEVFAGKKRVQVGNVTIPANKPVPSLGEIIEVRYLYAFKGGSVYQPVFLHVRDDLNAKDCVIGQLKYKADDTDEES